MTAKERLKHLSDEELINLLPNVSVQAELIERVEERIFVLGEMKKLIEYEAAKSDPRRI